MAKKFLKILGVFVLVLAAIGLAGYVYYFMPDAALQERLKTEFGAEYFDPAGAEVAVGDQDANKSIVAKVVDKVVRKLTGNDSKGVVSQADTTAPAAANFTEDATAQSGVMVSEEEIIQKYQPQFQSLQSQATGRMEGLFSAGLSEYRQQQKAGTLNKSELARKYIQAGKMVESNVDSQFYRLLNAMNAELIANNQSTGIIATIEDRYINAKASKRSELLSRVGL
jgi:hypothetical protein